MKELSALDTGKKPALKKRTGSSGFDKRPILAILAAVVMYVFLGIVCRKYPFGQFSLLISDLEAQYAPFLALYRSKLLSLVSGGSDPLSALSYSFSMGLGKNFLGSYGYYLASPLNIIYLLIDVTKIDLVVFILIAGKLSLSAGTMCLFLCSRTTDKKSIFPIVLALFYAFSLYAQVFAFHIMWLDGYMLLPLLLYFIERFIKEQKIGGILVTLLLLFATNYYIAYMAGIFSFFYLCVRLFVIREEFKTSVKRVLKYVCSAVICGLVLTVLILPIGLDTLTNGEKTIVNGRSLFILYNPVELMSMLLLGYPGDFKDIVPSNLPLIFMGLPITILVILYLVSKTYSGREKTVHILALIGIWLSTAVYWIDKMWQVFDDPNWFWHRHAFVFLPVFLVIALRALEKIGEISRKDMLITVGIMMFMIVTVHTIGGHVGEDKIFIYNTILTLAYCGLLYLYSVRKFPKQLEDIPQLITPMLTAVCIFELAFVGPTNSSALETMTIITGNSEELSLAIEELNEFGNESKTIGAETGAMRASVEKTPNYSKLYYAYSGEEMFGDYYGVALFNSNSNKQLHRFLKQFGFAVNYNYFAERYTYSAPSTDAFLSVGSVASMREISFYPETDEQQLTGVMKFYKNENVLPVAFAVDDKAMDFDFFQLEKAYETKDYFAFQNDWYRSMFPEQFTEDFFITLDDDIVGKSEIINGSIYNGSNYYTGVDLENRSDPDLQSEVNSSLAEEDAFFDILGYESDIVPLIEDNLVTVYRMNDEIPICINYEFVAPNTSEMYLNLSTYRIVNDTKVYVNGLEVAGCGSDTFYSQIYRLGSFEEGEQVNISIQSDCDSWTCLDVNIGYFDLDSFNSQFAKLDLGKVTATKIADGYVDLSVNGVGADETVITTVPYENGWTLYIDGQEAEIKPYQGAFIAFKCPEGTHTAELRFIAPGLKTGAVISGVGIVALAVFVVLDIDQKKKVKKDN
jgi:uncharacterized membrane protein YfhO